MDEESVYSGPERRTRQPLSDEQIEHIAQRAAELAVQKMTTDVYASVGKSVLQKVLSAARRLLNPCPSQIEKSLQLPLEW